MDTSTFELTVVYSNGGQDTGYYREFSTALMVAQSMNEATEGDVTGIRITKVNRAKL